MAKNNLKKELDDAGKSQEELSKISGVSTSSINKVYNQKRVLAPKTNAKIVKGLVKLTKKNYKVEDIFI